jgi:hypothetical protein
MRKLGPIAWNKLSPCYERVVRNEMPVWYNQSTDGTQFLEGTADVPIPLPDCGRWSCRYSLCGSSAQRLRPGAATRRPNVFADEKMRQIPNVIAAKVE